MIKNIIIAIALCILFLLFIFILLYFLSNITILNNNFIINIKKCTIIYSIFQNLSLAGLSIII